ncbi:hypothetical protein LOZ86_01600 [Pectobacterium parvum]|uniref:Cytidylyltransferase domain-containing protein n=1 Tax=Pectobacterium parvum TaxID=2778550 RepID=A0AAP9LC98_9GAMM|nr:MULTISPECIES: hypothetical protein [Pectobacterium]POE01102.1 hypothetical protein BVY05_11310 [Pectobacterium odoriferum]POE09011.1 hypothetical protein BV921_13460 [Pectobacterium odoriferum]QHQ24028.1 hypothetical protein GMX10_08060 [Pectobacterium parvum]RRO10163.1 hypothetical protein DMB81_003270 [Pectobacterium aquaticum]UFK39633.1 hypothetical protein LOZ86_01600 [Pectobacterium parvum]
MKVNIINIENNNLWAVVPARCGSKGFPGKNIYPLDNTPLLAHSIMFAKSLPFVNKVILSTDSNEYSVIGKRYGAEIPFLRSSNAAKDDSMEEDVLLDILNQCIVNGITPPDHILWLRPTHPFRDKKTFLDAYKKYRTEEFSSICIVTREDPRIFKENNHILTPLIKEFEDRSMVRRQDCEPSFRIFSGELFKFPGQYEKKFLGEKIGYVVSPDVCKFDIDYKEDIDYINYLLSTEHGRKIYGPYLNKY